MPTRFPPVYHLKPQLTHYECAPDASRLFICAAGDIHGAIDRLYEDVLAFETAIGQSLERLYVSSVTLAEMRFWIELVPDANRRGEPTDWLTNKVRPMCEQRVLQITEVNG